MVKSFANIDWQAIEQEGYENRRLQHLDNDRYLFVPRSSDGLSLHHIHCYEPDSADFLAAGRVLGLLQ